MIIGIDYRPAISSVRGIGYYVKSIVESLSRIDEINTYYLYVNKPSEIDLPVNFHLVHIECRNLVLYEQYYLPKYAKDNQVDVMWYPSNSGPLVLKKQIKLVVTVHDLAFIKSRMSSNIIIDIRRLRFWLSEKYRTLTLRFGLKRIDSIITVSRYSSIQILKHLHRTSEIIYNQISSSSNLCKDLEILKNLGVEPGNYIYTMTGEAPHKNLSAYVELFKDGNMEYPLVISGVYSVDLIKELMSPYLIFTGYLNEEEKNSLYANARSFVFLSSEEGFGLPILEAMRFGIPIVCLNRGAVSEIGAGGIILVDSEEDIKVECDKIETYDLEEMKNIQRAQLQKFSDWGRSAEKHLSVFRAILGK